MPMHAFCSPQKGSRFTFPSQQAEWLIEATRLHLQWRNRAGLAPDFPVMPVVGTRGADGYITILGSLSRTPDSHTEPSLSDLVSDSGTSASGPTSATSTAFRARRAWRTNRCHEGTNVVALSTTPPMLNTMSAISHSGRR